MPFVEFRANRIVSGEPEPLGVAGIWGWILLAACLGALVVALMRPGRTRKLALLALGAAITGVLPWALGASALALDEGSDSIARVSIGFGAWLALTGGVIVWYAGDAGMDRRGARWGAVVAVVVSVVGAIVFGGLDEMSLAKEYQVQAERFWQLVGEHLTLAGAGLFLGVLVGIPLGVLASRNRYVREPVLAIVGIIQTIPSLALLGLLVLPLAALGLPGIGPLPAIVALTLYALLPIVRNTYVGLAQVDPGALDAGRGMGMSRVQLLIRVEAPLALPLALEGVRSATVLVIGITAVTAFVGAGGLGIFVFQGWGQQADDLTLLGALPMVVLAVAADAMIRGLATVVVSPGIRGEAT